MYLIPRTFLQNFTIKKTKKKNTFEIDTLPLTLLLY